MMLKGYIQGLYYGLKLSSKIIARAKGQKEALQVLNNSLNKLKGQDFTSINEVWAFFNLS